MYLHCQYSTGGRSDMLENREKSAHKYFVTTDILVINFNMPPTANLLKFIPLKFGNLEATVNLTIVDLAPITSKCRCCHTQSVKVMNNVTQKLSVILLPGLLQ